MAPRFSIITPVYNTKRRHLEECITSVLDQTFGDWELCLVDDKSTKQRVRRVLDRAASIDPRIRVCYRTENGGIVAASNDALFMARGDFVVLLDHDDAIEPDALALVDNILRLDHDVDYVYTDETLMTADGSVVERFHKPDWSPERFRHQMYVCHLSTIRRSLVLEVGGFHEGFDGAQDYDLILRVTERARKIAHVPALLYHWRMAATSVANNASAKPYAYDAGRRAIEAHLDRSGVNASVERLVAFPGNYRLTRNIDRPPTVDVFLPNTGVVSEVWGLPRVHSEETLASLVKSPGVPIRVNTLRGEAARRGPTTEQMRDSDADVLVLVSEALEPCVANWAMELVQPLSDPSIGIVSGVSYTANSRLQHAGFHLDGSYICSPHFRAGHEDRGQRAILETIHEVSAVDQQCVAIRRSLFDALSGFDESLETPWRMIDFCLRAAQLGKRTVVNPRAEFLEFSNNDDFARRRLRAPKPFRQRWIEAFTNDPFRPKTARRLSTEAQRPSWHPRPLRTLPEKSPKRRRID